MTSEDTGAYGRDIGTDLPTLLWRLVQEIPEGAMLRLGMTNPPYILEHLEVCTDTHILISITLHFIIGPCFPNCLANYKPNQVLIVS